MATLSLGSSYHQLAQTRSRAMSKVAAFATQRLQQRVICSCAHRMQTASHGVAATSMTRPMRSEVLGMGAQRKVARGRNLVGLASPGAWDAEVARIREEDSMSMTSLAGFKDRAEILPWKGEEEPVGLGFAAVSEWRLEFETLVSGHVGKFAFLAILLMGVGVGCMTNVGDAEAATNHINSNGGLDVDMRALAMGPEGPLLEEFWDNMRRYGLYFLTVVTGGVYQLVKPIVDALKNPLTAVLVILVVSGSLYLVGLTVSAMLGINEYSYQYAQ